MFNALTILLYANKLKTMMENTLSDNGTQKKKILNLAKTTVKMSKSHAQCGAFPALLLNAALRPPSRKLLTHSK